MSEALSGKPGFHFFSTGAAWADGYQKAVDFLRGGEGLLLLGPRVSDGGLAWIQDHALHKPALLLGERIAPWRDWVTRVAQASVFEAGQPFRVMNDPRRREFLKAVLMGMEESGLLLHLGPLWREERFFSGLLECVEEARLAGLHEAAALERAKALMESGADQVSREAYLDFWHLLLAFETKLDSTNSWFDFPALVRAADARHAKAPAFFALGFDRLSLVEAAFWQQLALDRPVYVPVAISAEEQAALAAERELKNESAPVALVRALLTGHAGSVHWGPPALASEPVSRPLLVAHVPSEEARVAAAMAAQAVADGRPVRFVLPSDFLGEEPVEAAFREELGLGRHFRPRKVLENPAARIFFHAFELKEREYELAHGLEFAQLLQFTLGRFHDLPAEAARLGVRKGLADWRGQPGALGEFGEILAQLDALVPNRAKPVVFAAAIEKLAQLSGVAELARRAVDRDIEREAHGAFSALLRNSQMLAASLEGELSFRDWMREWGRVLAQAPAGEERSHFPRLQFYRYGDWLPPAPAQTVTLALGFDSGLSPRRPFRFYLEEAARRKLDLLFATQGQDDQALLDFCERLLNEGTVVLFRSHLDARGGEKRASWMEAALPLRRDECPDLARRREPPAFSPQVEVTTLPPQLRALSASFLEAYQECPFKAFALKVLRLEDKMQAASLDMGAMDLGSIVHKALELFYGPVNRGKEVTEPAARAALLELCLGEAVAQQKVEYFKGSEALRMAQVARLRRLLLEFLALDQENYARFPAFGDPLVETRVVGALGPHRWEGKVDRIDFDPRENRFLVLDYKIGATTPSSAEVKALERFQLSLYMDAVEKMHPGSRAAGGLYVSLKTGERKQGLVDRTFNEEKKNTLAGPRYYSFHPRTGALLAPEEFADLRAETLAEAARLAEAAQTGYFPVRPRHEESCNRCEARPACRVRQIQAPPLQPWRPPAVDFSRWLQAPALPASPQEPKVRRFNEEQEDALAREGELVFVEASAGTGKTTVIVEKIRRFLASRLAAGDAAYRAVERFAAISFTEKSASELAERVGEALLHEPGMGPRVAAQAVQQITTIHGFCRKIVADFPLEAGLSPLAELLDPREAESLRAAALEEFFLQPPPAAAEPMARLFALFSRPKVEGFLRRLVELRLLLRADEEAYTRWFAGELEEPEGRVAPEGEERAALEDLLALAACFAEHYAAAKVAREALDFNDLEERALRVLASPGAQAYYRERFGLLLVDEFQDTNSVQRQILERVAAPAWANLFVVGDAKQSIYRFRAADVSVFQGLRREAAAAGQLVTLHRNYRSRRELVAAANRVTESMFPAAGEAAPDFEAVAASAVAFRPEGGRFSALEYGDGQTKLSAGDRREREAALVASLVQERLVAGVKPGAIAVLLRKISSNEAYLQALTRAGIPFRVGSSRGFYGQSEVLDGIALLRALFASRNDMALLAVLRSPWMRLPDDKILEIQRRGEARTPLVDSLRPEEAPWFFRLRARAPFLASSELLSEAYREYPLDRRGHLQTVKLLTLLSQMEKEALPRAEIIERLSRWCGWHAQEEEDDDSTLPEPGSGGAVQVMTVHAAKGLEFDCVILPDLTSPPQPDRAALRAVPGLGMALKLEGADAPAAYADLGERDAEREAAESKRLLYVAMTRAKEECVLVLPRVAADAKPGKRRSWADLLRDSGVLGQAGKLDEVEATAPPANAAEAGGVASRAEPRALPLRMETSISELAAYQFCGEFHRRKFVQGWDDRVVALWPKPRDLLRQARSKAVGVSAERQAAAKLLKDLGIENKERGIALHRMLERADGAHLPHGRRWLTEAYESQGVDVSQPALGELIELDMGLLQRFLSSPLGQSLFDPAAQAYPEAPFRWRVGDAVIHGVMDRLLRQPDGTWVVVDYKSSILEESRDRYRFQVASYMAAVAEHARGLGDPAPKVLGYLVDLYANEAHPVHTETGAVEARLREEIRLTRGNYTLADGDLAFSARGLAAGPHCFSCPYSLHCDNGREFVSLIIS